MQSEIKYCDFSKVLCEVNIKDKFYTLKINVLFGPCYPLIILLVKGSVIYIY